MAKSGRPRKAGSRYPSGDLKPQVSVNQIKRGIARAVAEGRDPWLGSQLGWLAITPDSDTGRPLVTPEQVQAGQAFAALVNDYARAVGLPRRSARTGAFEVVSAGEVADTLDERVSGLRRRYSEAIRLLSSDEMLETVVSVCVDDEACPWHRRALLVRGLDILVRHFVVKREKPAFSRLT